MEVRENEQNERNFKSQWKRRDDDYLNARETLAKFYPELTDKVLPVIEELGL